MNKIIKYIIVTFVLLIILNYILKDKIINIIKNYFNKFTKNINNIKNDDKKLEKQENNKINEQETIKETKKDNNKIKEEKKNTKQNNNKIREQETTQKNKKKTEQKINKEIKQEENINNKTKYTNDLINKNLKKLEKKITLPMNVSLTYKCSKYDQNNIINYLKKNMDFRNIEIISDINYQFNDNKYEIKKFNFKTELKYDNNEYNCTIEISLIFTPINEENIFINNNIFNKKYGNYNINFINLIESYEINKNNTNNINYNINYKEESEKYEPDSIIDTTATNQIIDVALP